MLWTQHQHRCIHDMIQNRDADRSKHLVRDEEALYSLADSKLQYFLFFFAIYQHPGNGIHTCTHTLALTTLPFSSITRAWLMVPFLMHGHQSFVYLPVFSSQQTHLCLKIFTLVCYSDLEYSSLSSSQTTMSLQQSTLNFTSLLLNFILEMSYFQFQFSTIGWWWSSLFLFFSQPLLFPDSEMALSFIFHCYLNVISVNT